MSNREFKFKIDENLPIEAAKIFKRFGYDAETVLDEGLQGSSDDELFLICKKENRILVTFDLDFSDVRTYSPGAHPGVIVRLKRIWPGWTSKLRAALRRSLII